VVLAVTAQLVTGGWLAVRFSTPVLAAHLIGGLTATVLVALEWLWLGLSRYGRRQVRRMFGPRATVTDRVDGWFLALATVTVGLGLWLAAAWRLGAAAPLGILFTAHRLAALLVALLWLVHLAQTRHRRRG